MRELVPGAKQSAEAPRARLTLFGTMGGALYCATKFQYGPLVEFAVEFGPSVSEAFMGGIGWMIIERFLDGLVKFCSVAIGEKKRAKSQFEMF